MKFMPVIIIEVKILLLEGPETLGENLLLLT